MGGNKKCSKVNEEESEEFWTGVELRQGCCLSPALFIIYIAEIEKELGKAQVRGGVTVGKERFLLLSIRGRRGLTRNEGGGPKKYDEEVRELFRQDRLDAERRQVQDNGIWKGKDENEESGMEIERTGTRNSQGV